MSDYLLGSDVVVGWDWTDVRDKGFAQMRAMQNAYKNAPVEVQRKYHAEALSLQQQWNEDVGRWQMGFGPANTSAKLHGETAERLREKIAKDSGQSYVPIAKGTSVTEDVVDTAGNLLKKAGEAGGEAVKSLVPWWVWLIGGLAVGGVALSFAAPHVVRAVVASRRPS